MRYPKTDIKPVTDSYYGIPVLDPYRWLEDAENPEVKTWTNAQNKLTREHLDAYPGWHAIFDRMKALHADTTNYYGLKYINKQLFAIKWQPPRQQPFLVLLSSPYDINSERVVFDPNTYDDSGSTSIDFFQPSPDGRFVAISLSKGGSEDGTVYVFAVETGLQAADVVPRVNFPTGGGSVTWNADSSGFYYTRYPHEGERSRGDLSFYQKVYFHHLGDPFENDQYVIGKEFPRIAEIELSSTKDARYVLALVQNGDGGEMNHYLRNPSGKWTEVTRFEDEAQLAELGPDGFLYLLSRKNAPNGKIIRIPLNNPTIDAAELFIPEQVGAIEFFERTPNYLYLVETHGGPHKLRVFGADGGECPEVPIEPISSVWQIAPMEGDEILYRSTSYVTPFHWNHYKPETQEVRETPLFTPSPVDFNDCEVVREFAISRDGTRVPINIIMRRGTKLDGNNPTLLTGYGGYGISLSPFYRVRHRIWMDEGGIFVVANLRGGGEYGEAWHKAGNLTNKQNVFDDFISCAKHLIDRKYTSPVQLCIQGGSNGGLLMGAALTQAPELFRAVVSRVGIYDMLRVELDPNGEFNITEFGTVKNPQQFEALYDYSPYHRVAKGTQYPSVLLATGENDGRVNPAHSRKMTALLQAASGSANPVLLRTNAATGHGLGTSLDEMLVEETDVFAYLFSQLGISFEN